jgi:hypothetical protein
MPVDKQKRKKYDAERYKKNKKINNENAKKWRKEHPEEVKAHYRKYYRKHAKARKKAVHEYHKKNVEQSRRWGREHGAREREKILSLYGKKCNTCGYSKDVRALQLDHINGNGKIDRKKTRVFKYVLENKKKFQILCANCNWIKRYTNNEMVKCV